MRREVLRMDLGQPDGVNAEETLRAAAATARERAETGWVSSVLTEIESFRALARYAPDTVSRLPAVLDQIELIDLDPPIRILAQAVRPAAVRSLAAIHLGTALHRPQYPDFLRHLRQATAGRGRSSRPPGRHTRIPQSADLMLGSW